jgi:hypothetical protein
MNFRFGKQLAAFPILFLGMILMVVNGCHANSQNGQDPGTFQTAAPTRVQIATSTPYPMDQVRIFFAEEVPAGLKKAMILPKGVNVVNQPGDANMVFGRASDVGDAALIETTWHYVIAAPFPRGSVDPTAPCTTLLASPETMAALEDSPASDYRCDTGKTVPAEDMLQIAGKDENTYAMLPFEELSRAWQPRDDFGYKDGGITVKFSLQGERDSLAAILNDKNFQIPATNFDTKKLASVILTGTTALTRGTGILMDEKGSLYPAAKIGDLLKSADITHISNEIAFDTGCVLEGSGTKFCSKPQYFDLLKEIGTDVIELTGNHEMDYGTQPFFYSLDLYAKNGIPYYGGGRDPSEAAQPLKVEINGNRLAFLGCNAVGPDEDLAQEGSPGSNPCDIGQLRNSIQELRNEGYNPIVTFQHMEVCQAEPVGPQRGDFQRAADAGAVIVSGSQGHCPQVMEFYRDVVIHYGLGNLFFDQMDKIERMAFVDRYWFYDNRLVGVEPIPIIRDDAAQPRQMTVEEAQWFIMRYLPSLGGTP